MKFSPDAFQEYLPYYLTHEKKVALDQELKKFPTVDYCLSKANKKHFENEILQGDGLTNLCMRTYGSNDIFDVVGIVLSNSCDISYENKRFMPVNILFAPLISLEQYRALLQQNGIAEDRINSRFDAIARQEVTDVFYLPAGGNLLEDSIISFQDIHYMPLKDYQAKSAVPQKIFTLSQVGFYLFLMKLSVHFCRFHENIDRQPF